MSDEAPAGAPPATEDTKPNADHINLRVVGQNGNEVYFKIRRNTPLRKLMNAYCDRQSLGRDTVRFLVDGERLQDDATPDSLDLEDNDVIDVVLHQAAASELRRYLLAAGAEGSRDGWVSAQGRALRPAPMQQLLPTERSDCRG
eukprot:CAMPEP_0114617018 /NCGR_PEP_ID=MMETSP0168-20121206/6982_1 /TAXON_ID=95228 ORGANISM="Vannella sp., Strain DIVA3 517/6/12" /NCGR_SAMPLE_ID=MMETSP0168 /ASSEMBLY_ACC=CAM_ASM_000044 /LENGTH=143 /DNA_ID=CAMNT_0001828143 /DNA_START=69 /DNA_END=501 /DNA_ORIENTATION=+